MPITLQTHFVSLAISTQHIASQITAPQIQYIPQQQEQQQLSTNAVNHLNNSNVNMINPTSLQPITLNYNNFCTFNGVIVCINNASPQIQYSHYLQLQPSNYSNPNGNMTISTIPPYPNCECPLHFVSNNQYMFQISLL